MMNRRFSCASVVCSVLVLAGCSMGPHRGSGMGAGYGHGGPPAGAPTAETTLEPRSGSEVRGKVVFWQGMHHAMAQVEVSGLRPNSEHGFHVHEKGDCSAADATSAGGHFNPAGRSHGHYSGGDRHAGDLPNLRSDAAGRVRVTLPAHDLSVAAGERSVIGRSVVIHRDPDDYKSQPAGNSGPRIACGVIRAR